MIAEKIPLAAVGRTIRTAVCHGVAPAPRDASRRCSGTLERVLRERVDDRHDGEAHHEADDRRVLLHVGVEEAAARVEPEPSSTHAPAQATPTETRHAAR
jgi:GTP cyclohydrolase III